MRPILSASEERVEVNALFIQPTRWCALNCKGCYVKAHAKDKSQEDHILRSQWLGLIRNFMEGKKYWANQITISIDDVPIEHGTKYQIEYMYDLFNGIRQLLRRKEDHRECPEVHLTFRSPATIRQYLGESWHSTFQYVDMVSFSSIPPSQFSSINRLRTVTKVNHNHLIPANIDSTNIKNYIDRMHQLALQVDYIYLTLFKEPMCKEYSANDTYRHQERLRHDIAVINSLRKSTRMNDWLEKYRVDGCLNDTIRHHKTGLTCSSNVSRFQVWPNGSVTGCPYAYGEGQKGGRTWMHIMDNIKAARTRNDFRHGCYLPKVYDHLVRRPKSKTL